MGTGIVSILLNFIPFHTSWLYYLSVSFFILNTILFALALSTSILRYTLYPEIWSVMIRDPTNSLFLGTIPMGFATLIEQWVFICVPLWGEWAKTAAWVAWMIDTVAAVGVTVSLSFLLFVSSFFPIPLYHDTNEPKNVSTPNKLTIPHNSSATASYSGNNRGSRHRC
jgi:tellurite resistance protein TehA-like permease